MGVARYGQGREVLGMRWLRPGSEAEMVALFLRTEHVTTHHAPCPAVILPSRWREARPLAVHEEPA